MKRVWWLYALPVTLFIAGIVVSRSIGSWRALIIGIWTMILSVASLGGVIGWHATHKWYYALLGAALAGAG